MRFMKLITFVFLGLSSCNFSGNNIRKVPIYSTLNYSQKNELVFEWNNKKIEHADIAGVIEKIQLLPRYSIIFLANEKLFKLLKNDKKMRTVIDAKFISVIVSPYINNIARRRDIDMIYIHNASNSIDTYEEWIYLNSERIGKFNSVSIKQIGQILKSSEHKKMLYILYNQPKEGGRPPWKKEMLSFFKDIVVKYDDNYLIQMRVENLKSYCFVNGSVNYQNIFDGMLEVPW